MPITTIEAYDLTMDSKTVAELRLIAKDKGLENYATIPTEQLVDFLSGPFLINFYTQAQVFKDFELFLDTDKRLAAIHPEDDGRLWSDEFNDSLFAEYYGVNRALAKAVKDFTKSSARLYTPEGSKDYWDDDPVNQAIDYAKDSRSQYRRLYPGYRALRDEFFEKQKQTSAPVYQEFADRLFNFVLESVDEWYNLNVFVDECTRDVTRTLMVPYSLYERAPLCVQSTEKGLLPKTIHLLQQPRLRVIGVSGGSYLNRLYDLGIGFGPVEPRMPAILDYVATERAYSKIAGSERACSDRACSEIASELERDNAELELANENGTKVARELYSKISVGT